MRLHSNPLAVAVIMLSACAGGQTQAPAAQRPVVLKADPSQTPPPRAAQGHPRNDLIPRSALFGNPDRTDVTISPDGKLLAWRAPSDGVLNVWVAPIDKLDQAKPVTADKTRPVREYSWAFDNQHLLYSQDIGGDENYHVYRVKTATAEVTDLTPLPGVRAYVVGASERKPNSLLVAINDRDKQYHDVHHIDLRTGERKLLLQNDQKFSAFQFDHDLNPRLAEQMPADGSGAWFRYGPKNKSWIAYDQVPADDLLTTGIFGFDKSGKHIYASDSRGRNNGALVRIDLQTKRPTLLHEDPRVDLGEVLTHPTEHTVEAVLVDYDVPTWHAIDKKVQPDLDALSKLQPGTHVPHITARTLDDKTWIVKLETDRGAGKFYRWDRTKQKADFLFDERAALNAQPLVKMQPAIIPARDQLPLVSYLSLPKVSDKDEDGTPDAPVPLVLFVHGGPWSRDRWGYHRIHQLLANRGYAVLSVNYRGSTGFGKDYVNKGNKQWGKRMHDDLIDAVDWAIAKHVTTHDKVCIMGGSYGGYATLTGLTATPDRFACGVDIVGPSSIPSLLETVPPYWAAMMSLFHTRVGDPSSEEGKRALLEVSPLTHVDRIKRPLLIGQGANDPRVKKSESDQIVEAMQAKKIPVGYVVFPDEGHGFARPENDVAFFALAEAFLSVHLGGFFQPIEQAELKVSSLTVAAGRETLPGLPDTTQTAGVAAVR
ncbi:MAG: S9 family peptidase [Polyangiales bacterium]